MTVLYIFYYVREEAMTKILILSLCILAVLNCSARVTHKADIDMEPFGKIGIITFEIINAEGVLDEMATDILYGQLKEYLKKSSITKLGKEEGFQGNGPDAFNDTEKIKDLSGKHKVDAVFFGKITVSDMNPKMRVQSLMQKSRIQTTFRMTAELKLFNGSSGELVWSGSTSRQGNASYDHFSTEITPVFKVSDNDESYIRFVRKLIYLLTEDFHSSVKE